MEERSCRHGVGRYPRRKFALGSIISGCMALTACNPSAAAYSTPFKLEVLSHQDPDQLSSRQVAAIYDIRNPHQVVVRRCKLNTFGVAALESRKRERPMMKPIRCGPVPLSTVTTDWTDSQRRARST